MVEAQIGVAKVSKYAVDESGDTLELIERPGGGLSVVLADGQRSGHSARIISNIVARKAVSLLGEGVRDGAAARAAHDYLRTHRSGQVSAELQIVSIDLQTLTLVISRNTHCPAYVLAPGEVRTLDAPSQPIGLYPHTRPVIEEVALQPDTYAVATTDGVCAAGSRRGLEMDLQGLLPAWVSEGPSAQALADRILMHAVELDEGRPADDTSVLVVAVTDAAGSEPRVRRLSAIFPL